MKIYKKLSEWPEGFDASVIIGIDDIHPESSNDGYDCGGNINGGILERIERFMKKYPKVPVTLYITPDWRYKPIIAPKRFGRFRSLTTNLINNPKNPFSYIPKVYHKPQKTSRYRIDKDEYIIWRAKIKELIEKYPINIGIHGLTHWGRLPPFHKEFLRLSYNECVERLKSAKKIFSHAFKVDSGFIPPSYGFNTPLINALESENFNYVSLGANRRLPAKVESLLDCHYFMVPANYPCFILKNLLNLPRNWNLGRSNFERADHLFGINGVISVYGHACQNYYGDWRIDDGITPINLERLGKLIERLEKIPVWFTNASEISKHFIQITSNKAIEI